MFKKETFLCGLISNHKLFLIKRIKLNFSFLASNTVLMLLVFITFRFNLFVILHIIFEKRSLISVSIYNSLKKFLQHFIRHSKNYLSIYLSIYLIIE